MHSDWDIDERKIFRNGGLNLHVGGIAQWWQSGIIQILKEHTSEEWKQQKNFTPTVLQGSPKIWGLATGVYCAFDDPFRVKGMTLCLIAQEWASAVKFIKLNMDMWSWVA